MTYTGWELDETDRAHLLGVFEPAYPDVLAHHVTLRMGKHALPTETEGVVIGIADDRCGVQTLVISIGGTSRRPDGYQYHITWSIDRSLGRKPFDSKDVIESGFRPVQPYLIHLTPKVFL